MLFRDYRPMAFFGVAGVLWLLLALITYGIFGDTGLIWFVPAGMVAMLMAVTGLLSFTIGSILSVLSRRFAELEGKVDMVTTVGLGKDPTER